MWKVLTSPYFIKVDVTNNEISIFATNYYNIWSQILTKKSFLKILQESNEDIEFDDNTILLDKGVDMLLYPDQLKDITVKDKGAILSIRLTKSYGYVLWINLDLVVNTNACLFKEVIQPLLNTVNDLRQSQTELRLQLTKKDKEIEEYKCEGGEIALRHLKTEVYNDEAHMKKHQVYEKCFGDVGVLDELLQPIVLKTYLTEIKSKNDSVANEASTSIAVKPDIQIQDTIKRENIIIKTEPSSQDVTVDNSITDSNERSNIERSDPKIEPSDHENRSDNSIITSPNSGTKLKLETTPSKRKRNKLNF